MFSKEIYIKRREQLRKDIKTGLILIQGNTEASFNYPSNTYSFRQDSTFLYFFGLKQPDLFGALDCESGDDWIFGEDASMDDIIWMGDLPKIKQLAASVGVKKSDGFSKLQSMINDAIAKGRRIHILPPYRAENQMQLAKLLGIKNSGLKNYVSIDLIKACVKQRSIKSGEEIAEIEKAMETAYLMHTTAMKMSKQGVFEYEIAGKIEGIALEHGGPVSFPVILTINGQTLHNHYHGNKLKKGRLMLTDAGCETDMHYCSDITRTVPVGGKFDNRQKDIYEIVLDANLTATKNIKAGITYKEVHLKSCKVIASGLKDLGLMRGDIDEAVAAGAHALFMPHGLGHMMGLDVHDMENYGENYVGYDNEVQRSTQFGLASLRLGRKLQTGFVLTNEPGIYFIPALIDKWREEKTAKNYINFEKLESYKDFGGIRIEDDILVEKTGARVLGKPIPKTVAELEEIMS